MDLHHPTGDAGQELHRLGALIPRPRRSSRHLLMKSIRSWHGQDLAAGQRHGFPTPTPSKLGYLDIQLGL